MLLRGQKLADVRGREFVAVVRLGLVRFREDHVHEDELQRRQILLSSLFVNHLTTFSYFLREYTGLERGNCARQAYWVIQLESDEFYVRIKRPHESLDIFLPLLICLQVLRILLLLEESVASYTTVERFPCLETRLGEQQLVPQVHVIESPTQASLPELKKLFECGLSRLYKVREVFIEKDLLTQAHSVFCYLVDRGHSQQFGLCLVTRSFIKEGLNLGEVGLLVEENVSDGRIGQKTAWMAKNLREKNVNLDQRK